MIGIFVETVFGLHCFVLRDVGDIFLVHNLDLTRKKSLQLCVENSLVLSLYILHRFSMRV